MSNNRKSQVVKQKHVSNLYSLASRVTLTANQSRVTPSPSHHSELISSVLHARLRNVSNK